MTPEVEERLRGALAARADQITAADLQPAGLPSLLSNDRTGGVRPGGRLPFFGGRWVPALAGVAVAAVAVVFAVLLAWHPRQSSPPDRAPYLPGNAPASAPAPSRPGPANEQPRPLPDTKPPSSPDPATPPANSLPTGAPATLPTGAVPNAPTPTVSTAPRTTALSDPETVPPNVVPS